MSFRLCYFGRFWPHECRWREDTGQPDPCHTIPQARLKAEYKSRGYTAEQIAAAIWDMRIVVPGCRYAHGEFDRKELRLSLDQYPESTKDYAKDYGWFFSGERDGWLPDRATEAA